MLMSGCKVEYLGHRRGERIERAVTINAVIAWRLAAMTLMGRDTSELPPETFFSEIEVAALEDFAKDRRLNESSALYQKLCPGKGTSVYTAGRGPDEMGRAR